MFICGFYPLEIPVKILHKRCALFLHVLGKAAICVEGEGDRRVPQKIGDGFGVQPGPESIDGGGAPEIVKSMVRDTPIKRSLNCTVAIMIPKVIAKY